jgi:GGDEF domain-containing protein
MDVAVQLRRSSESRARSRELLAQLRALQNLLVGALRAAASNDEATGLCNRRAFVQSASRALDLAVRDGQVHCLIYFHLGHLPVVSDTIFPTSRLVLVRQMGHFLRDLYPGHGVCEIVGRLGASEFAALTPNVMHAARESILLRLRRPAGSGELPTVRLDIDVVHFDPLRPVAIEELLERARRRLHASTRVTRVASSALPPKTRTTHC